MNHLPFFYLICNFCADSQNQEPSVGWINVWIIRVVQYIASDKNMEQTLGQTVCTDRNSYKPSDSRVYLSGHYMYYSCTTDVH